MDESTFIFRGMKFLQANRIAPDGMPRFAASHLGLFCLPMSHKKDARLIWVNDILADQFFCCLHACTNKNFHMLIQDIFVSNIFLI